MMKHYETIRDILAGIGFTVVYAFALLVLGKLLYLIFSA